MITNSIPLFLIRKLLEDSRQVFDDTYLEQRLLSHPNYPSLQAVTDTLEGLGINHLTAKITKESIERLPELFLAKLRDATGESMVLVERKGQNYLIIAGSSRFYVSSEELKEYWTGSVLVVDANTPDRKYYSHILVLSAGLLALTIGVLLLSGSWLWAGYLALGTTGCLLSAGLLQEQHGEGNFLRQIFGTDKVRLNWQLPIGRFRRYFRNHADEILAFYFFSTSLTALFSLVLSMQFPRSLVWLALAGLPYSILLLLRNYRQTARLILSGLLGAQAILLVAAQLFSPNFADTKHLLLFGVISCLLVAVWSFVKRLWKKSRQFTQASVSLLAFQRNENLFLAQHIMQSPLKEFFWEGNIFCIGPSGSDLVLTTVLCPECSRSRALYQNLRKQTEISGQNFEWQLVFYNRKGSSSYCLISRMMIDVFLQLGPICGSQAVDEWCQTYGDEGLALRWKEKWSEKIKGNSRLAKEYALLHRRWCKDNGIRQVPAVTVNGKHLQPPYQPEDVVIFLTRLQDHYIKETQESEDLVLI
ncbi:MAG: hypothetical protein MI784_09365 [Cytophagales bacterium]|nr:hypothetical protein [Cytophagales bacterium]